MPGGWITLHRDIRDCWLWENSKEKSYFEAWTDMLMGASYKENKVLISGQFVHLRRGQIAWSISFMAKRWAWSVKKVRVFLQLLVKNGSILGHSKGSKRGKGVKVITICNYSDYQDIENTKGKAGASKGARQGQGRGKNITSKQVNNTTTDQKNSSISDEIPRKPKSKMYTPEFESLWSEYPKRPSNSKANAAKAYHASMKRGAIHSEIREGLESYAEYIRSQGWENTNSVKMASTFFGPGEHWKSDNTVKQKLTGVAATIEYNRVATATIRKRIQENQNERQQRITHRDNDTAVVAHDKPVW